MKNKVLITGGTGLVGNRLIPSLIEQGYEIHVLSRSKKKNKTGVTYFEWNPMAGEIDSACFKGVTKVINLAGAGVSDKRWTKKRKEEILQSRVAALSLIGDTLEKEKIKLELLITASATGYYGSVDTKLFTEEDNKGSDFLSDVVQDWEIAADRLKSCFTTITKVRIGIVLAAEGGAFQKITQPIKLWIGAPLGSGKQAISWIHIDDLCSSFHFFLEKNVEGILNAVTGVTTNKELTVLSAKALGKPLFLPNVPGFLLKLILGGMAEIVLKGTRVSGEKLLNLGFKPKFRNLSVAIADLVA